MAKVRHNNFMMGLSGKFGNIVFRQMKDGRTVVAAAPDFSNRKFSKEQQTHQSRFKKAAEYASEASKTNPLYAQLAQKRSKTPIPLPSQMGSTHRSSTKWRGRLAASA